MGQLLKYKYLNDITELSPQQHNTLTGLMLGDGSLRKPYEKAYLSVGRAQKDLDYLIYQYNIFKDFCPDRNYYSNRKTYREDKMYLQCGFATRYVDRKSVV